MSSSHLILCYPLFLLPSIFPSIRVFSNESVVHTRWPKYWSFSISSSPSNKYSRLISFKIYGFDLPAVQGSLKMQWTWIWANSGKWWGTGGLACCSPWGHKESDITGQLNNNTCMVCWGTQGAQCGWRRNNNKERQGRWQAVRGWSGHGRKFALCTKDNEDPSLYGSVSRSGTLLPIKETSAYRLPVFK